MPHYMFQGRYSQDAFKAMIADPQDREAAGRELVESMGGKLVAMYFMMGNDDVVAIVDAPDDETVAACVMVMAASGTFSGGHTTKLITSAEAMAAMKKAGSGMAKYTPAAG